MRRLLCGMFFWSGLLGLAGGMPAVAAAEIEAPVVPVFVYHRFGDDRYPSTNISVAGFRQQLEMLRERGYQVLTLGEALDGLERRQLPPRTAVLTVDDAYDSFLSGAMPLLREFGVRATLFVSTETVGRKGYLGWEQLRALAAEGIEIGNHSHAHGHFVNRLPGETGEAWKQRISADVERSQQLLHQNLGRQPSLMAYPFGEYDAQVQEIVRRLGFRAAAAQHSGVLWAMADTWAIPRFPMGGPFTRLEGFAEKLGARPLPVVAQEPHETLVEGAAAPAWRVQIGAGEADLKRLRCFVGGRDTCRISPIASRPGWYQVTSPQPLDSRRTKYTLTAPAAKGSAWFWHSRLWIRPEMPE